MSTPTRSLFLRKSFTYTTSTPGRITRTNEHARVEITCSYLLRRDEYFYHKSSLYFRDSLKLDL